MWLVYFSVYSVMAFVDLLFWLVREGVVAPDM